MPKTRRRHKLSLGEELQSDLSQDRTLMKHDGTSFVMGSGRVYRRSQTEGRRRTVGRLALSWPFEGGTGRVVMCFLPRLDRVLSRAAIRRETR